MFELFNIELNKVSKKFLYAITLFLLVILTCSCATKVISNDDVKETIALGVGALIKENNSKQNKNYSTKVEVGDIVLEIPEYYDVSKEKDGYNIFLGTFKCMAIAEMNDINTEKAKSNIPAFSDAFKEEMTINKTEESMVDNNYILKFIGSSGKDTMVFAVLVNDSANKAALVRKIKIIIMILWKW